jgi:hypothetical protein
VLLVPLIITIASDQGYFRNYCILPCLVLALILICLHLLLTSEAGVTFGLKIKSASGARHPMLATAVVIGVGAVLGGGLAWGWWIGLEKSKEHLAALALQSSESHIEAPPKIERPRLHGNAESPANPEAVIHVQLTAEMAPGQAQVQVKNTGERAAFTATARITSVIEHPPTGNLPFLHSYPLRWTVNNQHEISLENGAPGQLLIASTNQVPTRPPEGRLYELILESYQGGTPSRPGTFRWNGGEPDGAVKVFLEVTVASAGHGAITEHFVVTSMKWSGIKIERVIKEPESAPAPTETTPPRPAPPHPQPPTGESLQTHRTPIPVDWERHRRREAARERYIAFILMAPAAGDNIEAIRRFGDDMQVAADLFGEPIYKYLDTIYKNALDLRSVREQKKTAFARGLPQSKIEGLVAAENGLVAWFTAQHSELREKLAPFLNLADHPPVGTGTLSALPISQQPVPQPPPSLTVDKRMENDRFFLAVENTGGEIAVHGLIAAVVGMSEPDKWPPEQVLASWEPKESHVTLKRGHVRRLTVARRTLLREGYRWFVAYIHPDGGVMEAATVAYPIGNKAMLKPAGNPAEIRIRIVADSPNSEILYSQTFVLCGETIREG